MYDGNWPGYYSAQVIPRQGVEAQLGERIIPPLCLAWMILVDNQSSLEIVILCLHLPLE